VTAWNRKWPRAVLSQLEDRRPQPQLARRQPGPGPNARPTELVHLLDDTVPQRLRPRVRHRWAGACRHTVRNHFRRHFKLDARPKRNKPLSTPIIARGGVF